MDGCDSTPSKNCTMCGESKKLTNEFFVVDRRKSSGFTGHCRVCAKAIGAAYRKNNADRIRITANIWAANNREKLRSVSTAWNAAHREKAKASTAVWRVENPERQKQTNRQVQQNRRARKKSSGGRISHNIAQKLYLLQRGKCACCGVELGGAFHIDHVMPLALGGTNNDLNIQLLAPQCNLRKSAKHPIDYMQSQGYLL